MILVYWLTGRLLLAIARRFEGWSCACYRAYYSAQERRRVHREQRSAIERVIAESRAPSRVGSPLHRDR